MCCEGLGRDVDASPLACSALLALLDAAAYAAAGGAANLLHRLLHGIPWGASTVCKHNIPYCIDIAIRTAMPAVPPGAWRRTGLPSLCTCAVMRRRVTPSALFRHISTTLLLGSPAAPALSAVAHQLHHCSSIHPECPTLTL